MYAHLPKEQTAALMVFLRKEWKIFAWCPADMPGIPREFVEHALHIKPNNKPVKQALRRSQNRSAEQSRKKSTDYSTHSSSEKRRKQPGLQTQSWFLKKTLMY